MFDKQSLSILYLKDFHRRVVPLCGLDKIIVPDDLLKTLREIVQFEKARHVAMVRVMCGND